MVKNNIHGNLQINIMKADWALVSSLRGGNFRSVVAQYKSCFILNYPELVSAVFLHNMMAQVLLSTGV